MKNLKKIASLVLALVMAFSLAITASAAGTNSITVTSAVSGETYKIYKMFDLSVNDDLSSYTYTVNAAWNTFFTTGAGKDYVTIENGYVTAINDAAALAAKAAEAAATMNELNSIKATETTVAFNGLDNGYYLITSTLGTKAMAQTTPEKTAATINEKNPKDTVDKKVKEDSTENSGKENDAQVGDTVDFDVTITLVPGTVKVAMHDTMDAGLDYVTDSVAIVGLTKGTDYTVNEAPTDGCTFCITFTDAYIAGLKNTTKLVVTYNAVLNEKSIVKNADGVVILDAKNKAKVSFGDSQSVDSETITKTHSFSVFKHAKDSTDNLAGAVFSLKKNGSIVKLISLDDNNYRVAAADENGVDTFTTVEEGDIVIWGVDADNDYTLEEITAPAGYNKLSAEVEVTVDAGNSTRVGVENQAGSELPSTGGMGTTLFYVFGGILVAAAVVLLVTKKRVGEAQ